MQSISRIWTCSTEINFLTVARCFKSIFTTVSASSKNGTQFKSGQYKLKNIHLALSQVYIRHTHWKYIKWRSLLSLFLLLAHNRFHYNCCDKKAPSVDEIRAQSQLNAAKRRKSKYSSFQPTPPTVYDYTYQSKCCCCSSCSCCCCWF